MATQKATWLGIELLDRHSVLVNEDGSTDELQPDLAKFLQDALGPMPEAALKTTLHEILWDIGIGDMGDLNGASLTEILEGIF